MIPRAWWVESGSSSQGFTAFSGPELVLDVAGLGSVGAGVPVVCVVHPESRINTTAELNKSERRTVWCPFR
ncbi:hypothetical protein Aglo03_59320 [Actinokineospora globicatena]|uniref:Uncharacterized protein n=1 Tax=Actinokineospora globicatena TaxID=103729 RepID=A0A9W6QQL0_9PSEU|nr:hypothetical protein Aglo03_59320 [Actinokineospora globicatena]